MNLKDEGFQPDRMKITCCGEAMRDMGLWPWNMPPSGPEEQKLEGRMYRGFVCDKCTHHLKTIDIVQKFTVLAA